MGKGTMEMDETGTLVEDLRTHANIVGYCRRMMASGNIRPKAEDIAVAADCSLPTVFWHFSNLAALYAEAVEDDNTCGAVLSHVLGKDWQVVGIPKRWLKRIVSAIVTGR
jgi:hypothetical protein